MNSPETPVFDKSRTLYGLDRARRAIADTGMAIVVEGYMDAAMAQQEGVLNVVATLGAPWAPRTWRCCADMRRALCWRMMVMPREPRPPSNLPIFESVDMEGHILITPDRTRMSSSESRVSMPSARPQKARYPSWSSSFAASRSVAIRPPRRDGP